MTKYEELMSEYEELDIQEHSMVNEGLYCDGNIWIKEDLPSSKKYCILAEELGHHETSIGDILDQNNLNNYKQECKARMWAYRKILPFSDILQALSAGYTEVYDMAEHLDVDEMFLRECLKRYGLL